MWYWSARMSGELGRDGGEPFVPVGHGVLDAVRLGGRGHVLRVSVHCELERVADDAIGPAAGEHALLGHHLVLGAGMDAPADVGVLALVVLAHHEEVDVRRGPVAQRRPDAPQKAHRPEVDVLPELAADRYQQAPQRDMVGDAGKAHRTEEDGVVPADGFEPVLGHHPAGPGVDLAAPGKFVELEPDAVPGPGRFQHPDPFRDDLLADSVAGNHRDAVARHRIVFRAMRRVGA